MVGRVSFGGVVGAACEGKDGRWCRLKLLVVVDGQGECAKWLREGQGEWGVGMVVRSCWWWWTGAVVEGRAGRERGGNGRLKSFGGLVEGRAGRVVAAWRVVRSR